MSTQLVFTIIFFIVCPGVKTASVSGFSAVIPTGTYLTLSRVPAITTVSPYNFNDSNYNNTLFQYIVPMTGYYTISYNLAISSISGFTPVDFLVRSSTNPTMSIIATHQLSPLTGLQYAIASGTFLLTEGQIIEFLAISALIQRYTVSFGTAGLIGGNTYSIIRIV